MSQNHWFSTGWNGLLSPLLLALCASCSDGPILSTASAATGMPATSTAAPMRLVQGERLIAVTGSTVEVSLGGQSARGRRSVALPQWSSSDAALVMVEPTQSGARLHFGQGEGDAVVEGVIDGRTVRSFVSVLRPQSISDVVLLGLPDNAALGDTIRPSVEVRLGTGKVYRTSAIPWELSGTAQFVTDDDRAFIFTTPGQAVFSANVVGRLVQRSMTLADRQRSTLSVTPGQMTVGGTALAEVSFRGPDGQSMDCTSVTWSVAPSSGVLSVQPQPYKYRAMLLAASIGSVSLTAACDAATPVTQTVSVVGGNSDQPPTAGAIDLRVVRLEDGQGDSVFVSAGLPFAPGRLREADVSSLRLTLDGQEIPLASTALKGRHADGSVRSVLLQFAITPAVADRTFRLAMNGRTLPARPASPATGVPSAIVAPVDPKVYIASGIVGITAPRSETPASPSYFFDYESNWTKWEQEQWAINDNITYQNYYDRILAYFGFWVRTGNPQYFKRGAILATRYRDEYIALVDYKLPEWQNNLDGMMVHYLLTGDTLTRQAIILVASQTEHAYGQDYALADPQYIYMDNRVQTRVLNSKVLALMLGATSSPAIGYAPGIPDLRAAVASDLTAILSTQQADGAYRFIGACGNSANFMAGLLNGALAQYYDEIQPDPRIPVAISKSLDFLLNTQWLPDQGVLKYFSGDCPGKGGPTPAWDLNGLYLAGISWMYLRTHDPFLRERGDQIFRGGVEHTFISNGKQFNQEFQWSWRWLGARQQ